MKVYTADNEFPDCGVCDHICADSKFCVKYCGAEHGWASYQRTDITDIDEKLKRLSYKLNGPNMEEV